MKRQALIVLALGSLGLAYGAVTRHTHHSNSRPPRIIEQVTPKKSLLESVTPALRVHIADDKIRYDARARSHLHEQ